MQQQSALAVAQGNQKLASHCRASTWFGIRIARTIIASPFGNWRTSQGGRNPGELRPTWGCSKHCRAIACPPWAGIFGLNPFSSLQRVSKIPKPRSRIFRQGLKPANLAAVCGWAEAQPFYEPIFETRCSRKPAEKLVFAFPDADLANGHPRDCM